MPYHATLHHAMQPHATPRHSSHQTSHPLLLTHKPCPTHTRTHHKKYICDSLWTIHVHIRSCMDHACPYVVVCGPHMSIYGPYITTCRPYMAIHGHTWSICGHIWNIYYHVFHIYSCMDCIWSIYVHMWSIHGPYMAHIQSTHGHLGSISPLLPPSPSPKSKNLHFPSYFQFSGPMQPYPTTH